MTETQLKQLICNADGLPEEIRQRLGKRWVQVSNHEIKADRYTMPCSYGSIVTLDKYLLQVPEQGRIAVYFGVCGCGVVYWATTDETT